MREGDGEAVFLACAGPFGELARRLLADPRPRRWSGELTPLVVDGRPWAVMASFHGDDGEAVAALPLADVADADDHAITDGEVGGRGRRAGAVVQLRSADQYICLHAIASWLRRRYATTGPCGTC